MSNLAKECMLLLLIFIVTITCKDHSRRQHKNKTDELSLWINEQQMKKLSGIQIKVFAIDNGRVNNELRNPNFNQYLPTIPSEVNSVNFTWDAGNKYYLYNFDRLKSLDETILQAPTVSIEPKGRIPRKESGFSIFLPCTGNSSGTATFSISLSIQNRKGRAVPGTPLRLKFKKECATRGPIPDPDCDKKCKNNGFCNNDKICQCKEGYMGQYCQTALCYPQCMNGGNCTAPAVCSCPPGYQGPHCEGGICTEKCLNGGKCIQKDKCQCTKGYYGFRCEFSKCVIPCMNSGKCIGNNVCRCPPGFGGNHCEIGRRQRSICKKPCKHGVCRQKTQKCKCDKGWYGAYCNSRERRRQRRKNPKVEQ
ncbi:protein shifted isoform X2 [Hermetia illucens]|uniref:protein shifted isoform X2 n=1 Tax=Hermetia illucens TaxID=343691 RepID=UPI0018CC0B88|nr:protein shifted isoform X2 [Hermetia illucens]